MLPITINGQRVRIPTRWEDFTIERMQAVVQGQQDTRAWSDVRNRLAAYTGAPVKVFEDITTSADAIELVMGCLQFEETSVMDSVKADPGVIHFYDEDGRCTQTIRVPRDLGGLPSGCHVAFRERVTTHLSEGEELVNVMHYAIASMMQPLYTGRQFDMDAVESLSEVCLRCKFVEAMGVVGFFLRKRSDYQLSKANFSSRHTSQHGTSNTAMSSRSTAG